MNEREGRIPVVTKKRFAESNIHSSIERGATLDRVSNLRHDYKGFSELDLDTESEREANFAHD